MEFRDYYATLGVTKTATDKELKQAFRRLARKHHPDVNQTDSTAETRFKEVNEAYEVLGDPDTRRKYDELGANWKAYEQAGVDPRSGSPFGQPGSPFGQGGYRQVTPDEMGEMFGDANPFSDFFKTFFGAAGDGPTRRGARTRPRVQQEHELVIGLEEAFTGTARKVTLTSPEGERSLEVRFPAGITDGQKVRAASDGGDVFFRVRIAPHPRVERRGTTDLAVRVPVPVAVAVIGGEVEVQPLTGRAIRMRVPPGTAHGAVLRLRGHGMPVLGSAGPRGDLLVSLELQVPTELSAEERAHYEALAALRGAPRTQPA
ncbi:MAG: DnaJ C-terminal domain-containing protein [Luteitalea sp.]